MTNLLVDKIYDMLDNKNLTAENILTVTVHVMSLAQTEIKDKNQGDLKKEIVIGVLKKITIENVEDEELVEKLEMMINTCVPAAIDTMVQIARGTIDMGKTVKSCLRFCLR